MGEYTRATRGQRAGCPDKHSLPAIIQGTSQGMHENSQTVSDGCESGCTRTGVRTYVNFSRPTFRMVGLAGARRTQKKLKNNHTEFSQFEFERTRERTPNNCNINIAT